MAPEKFRVALVQMSCGPEPEQNLAKALERVADAAGRGAQVVCLPELFQTQYFCQREDHSLFDLAEPIPGKSSEKLAAAARGESHGRAIEATSLFDRAMDDLRHAAAMGYRNPAQYRYEPALAPLRGRDDFRLLMMDLAMPPNAFAR